MQCHATRAEIHDRASLKLRIITRLIKLLLPQTVKQTDAAACYMSLCAICFAAPLVAVRLNYKFVTKSCVFTDHFNQSNFHFCDNTNGLIYFKPILFLCLKFPKYNFSICIVHF